MSSNDISPVSGSTPPGPPIIDPGTFEYWSGLYHDLLRTIAELVKSGHAEKAYLKIAQLFAIKESYTENSQMVAIADRSNIISYLSKYLNRIQADFDHYSSGKDAAKDKTYAEDAQQAKADMEKILNDPKYAPYIKDIKKDVQEQLDAIFNVPSDKKDLAEWWASLWEVPDPSSASPGPYPGTAPVSNPIDAMRSSLQSQSSVLGSETQLRTQEASKALAFIHTCYQGIVDVIKAVVSATRSA